MDQASIVASNMASNLSVVVITLNEEMRLEACLRSLPPGCEIVVLDSGSTDGTAAVAKRFGARFEFKSFTDYATQKNAAVALATRPWVLSLDADEVLTPQLADELQRVTSSPAPTSPVAYRLRRSLVFMGQTMRFGKSSDRPVRLFRRGDGRFQSAIHERLELATGTSLKCLRGRLLHYSYDDLTDYFNRFNAYTTRIAENHAHKGKPMPVLALHILRPWHEFVMRYFLRLGFLDGYAGYTYALCSSVYTYVKYAKLRELAAGQHSKMTWRDATKDSTA